MQTFRVQEGHVNVNLSMKKVLSGMFKVEQEAQCGWNSVRRVVGNEIREVTRGQIRQRSLGPLL